MRIAAVFICCRAAVFGGKIWTGGRNGLSLRQQKKKRITMVNVNDKMLAILHDLAGGRERMTPANKAYLLQVCEALGIGKPRNARCANCWRDAATLCWIEARMRLEGRASGKQMHGYALREGVDVLYMGQRINAATLTDELARRILDNGFPPSYFAHIPTDTPAADDTHKDNR